jgi:hypothetical protein
MLKNQMLPAAAAVNLPKHQREMARIHNGEAPMPQP